MKVNVTILLSLIFAAFSLCVNAQNFSRPAELQKPLELLPGVSVIEDDGYSSFANRHFSFTHQLDSLHYFDSQTPSALPEMKTIYQYNNHGIELSITYLLPSGGTQYGIYSKREVSYNPQGLLESDIYYEAVNLTNWKPAFRYDYQYFPGGEVQSQTYSSWNSSNSSWEYESRDEYKYTSFNKVDSIITKQFPGTWTIDAMQKYHYDANNLLSIHETFDYNHFFKSYIPEYQSMYFRDVQGRLDSMIMMDYNYTDSTFKKSNRLAYIYDPSYTEWHYSWWNGQNWVKSQKSKSTYDSNGNEVLYERSAWSNNAWQVLYRSSIAYDHNIDFTQLLLPNGIFDGYNMTHAPVIDSVHTWNSGGSAHNAFQTQYFYSQFTVGIDEALAGGFDVFPNPVVDFLYLDELPPNAEAEIKLYNLVGSLCMKLNLKDGKFDLSDLQPGVYIAKIHSKEFSGQLKLIKK